MDPKTQTVIDLFGRINAIPRCSKNEAAICRWLEQWAGDHGFPVRRDAVANLVIDVPATPGYESAPLVVFQGHVDMVCEKRPEVVHDFTKDPITLVTDGDWLKADGTSLGADNGIAVALAMALATDNTIDRPPMELLMTVDEETGLTGAMELKPGFVKGRILLNVDSEDDGVFTVGCAGGKDATVSLTLETSPVPESWSFFRVAAGGMQGGHSGIDIAKHRANANKILARALDHLRQHHDVRLVEMTGGTVHNAIPRDSAAVFTSPASVDALKTLLVPLAQALRSEYHTTEPDMRLTVTAELPPSTGAAVSLEQSRRIIDLLMALPTGVSEFSPDIDGLVETSNNLAVVKTADGKLEVLSSQRSSVPSRLTAICRRVESLANLAGAGISWDTGYPPWPPDMASPLLARCKNVYRDTFGAEPVVEIIHAGLECAVIGSVYPGMDMISFGPTMKNPHSPDERLYLPSVDNIWKFLVALLASFKE
ncbi:MAG: aminoacyl-histidine dipeptidase [Pseudomonadota bacterium]